MTVKEVQEFWQELVETAHAVQYEADCALGTHSYDNEQEQSEVEAISAKCRKLIALLEAD